MSAAFRDGWEINSICGVSYAKRTSQHPRVKFCGDSHAALPPSRCGSFSPTGVGTAEPSGCIRDCATSQVQTAHCRRSSPPPGGVVQPAQVGERGQSRPSPVGEPAGRGAGVQHQCRQGRRVTVSFQAGKGDTGQSPCLQPLPWEAQQGVSTHTFLSLEVSVGLCLFTAQRCCSSSTEAPSEPTDRPPSQRPQKPQARSACRCFRRRPYRVSFHLALRRELSTFLISELSVSVLCLCLPVTTRCDARPFIL